MQCVMCHVVGYIARDALRKHEEATRIDMVLYSFSHTLVSTARYVRPPRAYSRDLIRVCRGGVEHTHTHTHRRIEFGNTTNGEQTEYSRVGKPTGKLSDPNRAITRDQLPRAGGSKDRLISC